MPIWNPDYETMPREQLEKLQLQRLREVAGRVAASPLYRKKFTEAKVSPDDLKSLDDLARLPFTEKSDLRDNYPYGMFVVPMEKVVRIHASSGTTGKPTVGGYSRADVDLWAEVMARTVSSAGVTSADVVHNAYGYGLFTGGLGFHVGADKVGATVIPMSGGLTRRQVMLMEDFGATVLTCTPSYSLVIAEEAAEMGVDFKKQMKVRVGIFGAEPWTEKMRHEIEAKLGLEAFDIYGLTEIIGPGVAVECPEHNGMHINDDHFLPEIIDPDTGERLSYGEEGELVFTTLTKEAMPVIRYRTRDRTRLHPEKCACGRTSVRMEKILGRTDDMLIVRGVNIFPQLIEKTLLTIEDIEPHYQIVIDRPKDQLDTLEVWVEASPRVFQPIDTQKLDELQERVATELFHTLGISVSVKLMGPKSIARSEGKAKRVVDKREMK
ncbi:MAG TPA: phenylacetate--CoA ligase [Anaerolineales bacterium]|nr:phenylacetate--CoA ligase [Anaerolineales bacterium]